MNALQKLLSFLHLGGSAAQAAASTPEVNAKIQAVENDLNDWISKGEALLPEITALGSLIPGAAGPIAVLNGYISVGVNGIKTAEKVFDDALAAAEKAGGYTGPTPTPPATS